MEKCTREMTTFRSIVGFATPILLSALAVQSGCTSSRGPAHGGAAKEANESSPAPARADDLTRTNWNCTAIDGAAIPPVSPPSLSIGEADVAGAVQVSGDPLTLWAGGRRLATFARAK